VNDHRHDAIRLNRNVEEVADALRISSRMVRILVSRGELRAHRIGRRVLISREALAAFIQEREAAEVK
jgi:excisionase family DNA binding protein